MTDLLNAGNTADGPDASGRSTGKPKQTRRRQRLSCVECTRRRQKCDRQIPCALCISRGVPHLCKWEPILARPDPQRPPDDAPPATQPQSTIASLTARIAALEDVIVKQNLQLTWGGSIEIVDPASTPKRSSTSCLSTLPEATDAHPDVPRETSAPMSSNSRPPSPDSVSSDDPGSSGANLALSRFDSEVQLAAAKMAQVTLAPPNEFVGAGTIFGAIHKLGDMQNYRYPYPRSGPTTLNTPLNPNDNPLTNPISRLVASLPPRAVVDSLVEAYFAERDWNYGLPGVWFRTACQQMWDHLDTPCPGRTCQAVGGCSRCAREISPNWLALLFAVLAHAPQRFVGYTSKSFFIKAVEARRLVEDTMLFYRQYSSPSSQSVVHGVSLGCLAAALLACWLSDHGRPSDAWKLTGTAIRQAQAAGLHRDPTWYKWEKMDPQECELRSLAWWYLIISDRLNSMILGRPIMAGQGTFDVKLMPGAVHGDNSDNPHVHFQQAMITLAQVIEEVISNGLSIRPRSYATVLETDKKLQVWHSKLHPSLDWRRPHATSKHPSPQERDVFYQRHTSASYFLGALMNLHRPYLMREPPILPLPGRSVVHNPSRERCIDAAMELVRILCDAHEEAARWGVGVGGGEQQVSAVLFHYAYCAFDGTVALVGALSQDPPHARAEECLALIYRATRMLEDIKLAHDLDSARRSEANIAARAITILAALRKAGRWDERFGRKDGTSLACSLAEPHVAAPASSCSPVSEPPGNLHEPGGLMLGGYPFDPAQFSGPGFDAHAQPATSAIPFLSTGGQAPVLPPFAGLQSAVMNQATERPGDLLDLGIYASLMAPLQMDPSWSRGAAQSMAMPFEMLQSSENDIDWGAVMNSTSDGGAGMNWSIG